MVASNLLLSLVFDAPNLLGHKSRRGTEEIDDIPIDFDRSGKCSDPVNATFVFTVLIVLVPALLNRVVNSGPLHPPLIDDEVRPQEPASDGTSGMIVACLWLGMQILHKNLNTCPLCDVTVDCNGLQQRKRL